MIPQHLKNYKAGRSAGAVYGCGNFTGGICKYSCRTDERESPQGLVKTLTIWYIKHNLWGYGKS